MEQEVLDAPTDKAALAIRQSIEQVGSAVTELDKIASGLAALEKAHPKNLACDVTTPKGMKEAIAGRAAWRDPRVATEKARKAAKAPVLALGKDIDARAAHITSLLLEGESNYDDQIKAEELRKEQERQARAQAELDRTNALRDRIAGMQVSPALAMRPAAEIEDAVKRMVAVEIGDDFQEFKDQAVQAHAAALSTLRQMHAAAVEREAEAARLQAEREELARLRAEAAERERLEFERLAAENAAETARLAAERAELAKQQAEQRRQQEAEEAQRRAEQKRLDDEAAAARQKADDEARAARKEADRAAAAARAEAQARFEKAEAEQRERVAAAAAERQAELERQEAADRAARAAAAKVEKAGPLLLAALVIAIPHVATRGTPEELQQCQDAVNAAA